MPLIDRGCLIIKPGLFVGGDAVTAIVPMANMWYLEGAIGPFGQYFGGTVITTLPTFCPVSTYR
jgi:hypothetical protein